MYYYLYYIYIILFGYLIFMQLVINEKVKVYHKDDNI